MKIDFMGKKYDFTGKIENYIFALVIAKAVEHREEFPKTDAALAAIASMFDTKSPETPSTKVIQQLNRAFHPDQLKDTENLYLKYIVNDPYLQSKGITLDQIKQTVAAKSNEVVSAARNIERPIINNQREFKAQWRSLNPLDTFLVQVAEGYKQDDYSASSAKDADMGSKHRKMYVPDPNQNLAKTAIENANIRFTQIDTAVTYTPEALVRAIDDKSFKEYLFSSLGEFKTRLRQAAELYQQGDYQKALATANLLNTDMQEFQKDFKDNYQTKRAASSSAASDKHKQEYNQAHTDTDNANKAKAASPKAAEAKHKSAQDDVPNPNQIAAQQALAQAETANDKLDDFLVKGRGIEAMLTDNEESNLLLSTILNSITTDLKQARADYKREEYISATQIANNVTAEIKEFMLMIKDILEATKPGNKNQI